LERFDRDSERFDRFDIFGLRRSFDHFATFGHFARTANTSYRGASSTDCLVDLLPGYKSSINRKPAG
jgi:hypothetical protein